MRHSVFVLSLFLVAWLEVSFDGTRSFAVENRKRSAPRPRKSGDIHTPAASTDRLDHRLTKTDKTLLSELNAAGKKGNWKEVERCFVPTRDSKTPMFNAYMTAAMRCEQFSEGALMYEKLCQFSLPKELVTYNLAVKLYAKSGQAARAREVAQEALVEFGLDHTLAAARLVAAAEVGDFQEAGSILEEMRDSEVNVDKGHVTTALRAVRTAKTTTSADATKLFQMALDLGLEPDVGLCNSFLSSLEEPEEADFLMMDDIVERFDIDLNSAYVGTYLRKLLLLGSGWWSQGEMTIHLQHVPESRIKMARRALDLFKTKIKMPKFCQTLKGSLTEIQF